MKMYYYELKYGGDGSTLIRFCIELDLQLGKTKSFISNLIFFCLFVGFVHWRTQMLREYAIKSAHDKWEKRT